MPGGVKENNKLSDIQDKITVSAFVCPKGNAQTAGDRAQVIIAEKLKRISAVRLKIRIRRRMICPWRVHKLQGGRSYGME